MHKTEEITLWVRNYRRTWMTREGSEKPETLEVEIWETVIAVGSGRELTLHSHLQNATNYNSYLISFLILLNLESGDPTFPSIFSLESIIS